jgi:succinate dehydrogenase/fumarate reductase flavoprotein subunit
MEVLDKDNPIVPIPGFYAAGVINVGWMSNDYGGTPGGSALGLSIAMGRIAAENAAKYAATK